MKQKRDIFTDRQIRMADTALQHLAQRHIDDLHLVLREMKEQGGEMEAAALMGVLRDDMELVSQDERHACRLTDAGREAAAKGFAKYLRKLAWQRQMAVFTQIATVGGVLWTILSAIMGALLGELLHYLAR